MFPPVDRRLVFGLLVSGTVIVIAGGVIWFKNWKTRKQILLDRSEYIVLKINVPNNRVGNIIGKGGEVIKRLQQDLSVRLEFFSNEPVDNDENYRKLTIRGQRQRVYEADVEIRRLLANLAQDEKVEMFIPETSCGFIIGKHGSVINEIRDRSNARLRIDRKLIDNVENKRYARLIISGTNEQIATAKALVEDRLCKLETRQISTPSRSFSTEIFDENIDNNIDDD